MIWNEYFLYLHDPKHLNIPPAFCLEFIRSGVTFFMSLFLYGTEIMLPLPRANGSFTVGDLFNLLVKAMY